MTVSLEDRINSSPRKKLGDQPPFYVSAFFGDFIVHHGIAELALDRANRLGYNLRTPIRELVTEEEIVDFDKGVALSTIYAEAFVHLDKLIREYTENLGAAMIDERRN